jgi:hypothetical protein
MTSPRLHLFRSPMTRLAHYGLLILWALCFASCRNEPASNIPDVSDIHVDIDLTRFEQLLLQDTTIDASRIHKLMEDYPAFSDVYFNHVMPGSEDVVINKDPETKIQNIQSWIKHPRTRWLYDTVQQVFPKVEDLKEGLKDAFTYAKYYFPEKETPRFFTTLSDFGYFPFIYAEDSLKDGIGISLEMFLGEKFPYRQFNGNNEAFSDYLIRAYNKDHLVKRTLEVWLDDLAGQPPGNRLIDIMIHNGKKLYIMQSLMPHTSDTVLMNYPSEKMKWVKDNERNIWDQFATQNLLYETSLTKIQKLIGPSPDSPGMPHEAPGNTGSWLGWQIVKSYMKKHPETTLKQLLALDNAQDILDQSGYRPPRK